MGSDTNNIEKAFGTGDISDILNIETVTVRKYALALEANGYRIMRDDHDRRVYTERDVIVFRHLQSMVKKTGMSVDKCASIVVSRYSEQASDSVSLPATPKKQRHDEQYDIVMRNLSAIAQEITSTREMNKEILNELMAAKKREEAQSQEIEKLRQQLEQQSKTMQNISDQVETLATRSQKKKRRFLFF